MHGALVELGQWLKTSNYRFTTPTPATHATVNARPENRLGVSLADILGWSRHFKPDSLPPNVLRLLERADAIIIEDNLFRSTVRFSSLKDLLLVHSAFPTVEDNAVFFGPDTYRFARVLDTLPEPAGRIVDVGCGTGAGGLLLGQRGHIDLVLTDVNEEALRLARANAEINGHVGAEIINSDVLENVDGPVDMVVANPPYLCDGPAYRDGGSLGMDIALRIVEQSLEKLSTGGRLALYTGAPVVRGVDKFREAIVPLLNGHAFTYEEIDPDLFGDELEKSPYAAVERIAAVSLVLNKGDHK